MANRDPAFLFYSSDFLTGVSDLTMEERGQYITLLCVQHQKGHLSEKTIRLCLGLDSVSEIKDILSKFKIDSDGNYYNKRLDIEIEKRISFTESRKINGSKGGRPRKNKKASENLVDSTSKASEKLIENEDEDENNNTNINDINNLFSYIESIFGRTLNPVEYERINLMEDNELTRYAVKEAALNRAYNIKYVEAIIRSYKDKGITSVKEAEEHSKGFRGNREVTYNTEIFDYDWLNDDEGKES